MPWKPMLLRGAKVLARVDAAGEPVAEDGRVEIRYKPNDGKTDWSDITFVTLADSDEATIICGGSEAAVAVRTTPAAN